MHGITRREWIARNLGPEKAAEFEVDAGPLAWLVDLLHDAGQVRVVAGPDGLHLMGLGWPELVAWLDGAQEHELAPLYRRGLLALSAAYAREATAAVKLESPAPFDPKGG